MLSQQDELSEEMDQAYEGALDTLINNTNTVQNMEYLKLAIKLAYKVSF